MSHPTITEIHIVREGGIPVITHPDKVENELVSMFCSALNTFGDSKFKSNIQSVRFNQGDSIFFKEFRIQGELMQVFILTCSYSKDTTSCCDQLAIRIKWLIEKYKLYSPCPLKDTLYKAKEELRCLIAR
jgi:hypothetical protein